MKRNLSNISNDDDEDIVETVQDETLSKLRRLITNSTNSASQVSNEAQEAIKSLDSNIVSETLPINSNNPNISNDVAATNLNNILLKKQHFQIRIPIAPPYLVTKFWKDLNSTKFENWTSEQVATLLLVDESHFGCNLSFEQAQQVYEREFDGNVLKILVEALKEKRIVNDGIAKISHYLFGTDLSSKIVNWVCFLIRRKFYYIWNLSALQFYKTNNNIKDEDVAKHFEFEETTINPNFIYCEKYKNFSNSYGRVIGNQINNENLISSLKSLLNLDHLISGSYNNNLIKNVTENTNLETNKEIKNKILINGSEEEYKLQEYEECYYNNNRHFYSLISPKGNENTKFLTNMASKYPSIIITGNSKDEIMLIEHTLSYLPEDRVYSGCFLLLITKLVYLLKIVESNLLNNLNMNEALTYLANCQLNTNSCEVIMKYLLDNHFDLIKNDDRALQPITTFTSKLVMKYLNILKEKYPNLSNDFVICLDNCDLLDKKQQFLGQGHYTQYYRFTFIETVIRKFCLLLEDNKFNNHLIFSNIYGDSDDLFPTGKPGVSSDIKIHPIYIENNIKMEDFINYCKNSNNFDNNNLNTINFDENEIEILKKMNDVFPIFPMRMELFDKAIQILKLEFTKIGFSKEWFENDGLLKHEGQLLSEFINLSEETLYHEHRIIWSILTTLYSTSLQILKEHDFQRQLTIQEKEVLTSILTHYIESFQNKTSTTICWPYEHLKLRKKLSHQQILFHAQKDRFDTYPRNDPFSYLQAKLCYNKWCLRESTDNEQRLGVFYWR